eukprot:11224745-Lingulodinium_polyedra.AAC.1
MPPGSAAGPTVAWCAVPPPTQPGSAGSSPRSVLPSLSGGRPRSLARRAGGGRGRGSTSRPSLAP